MMKARLRGTLVWKLYVIGFVQLIVLGAAVVGTGWLLKPPHMPPPDGLSVPGPPPDGRPPPPHAGPRFARPSVAPPLLAFLFSGLVIVGVGSLLTARWMVRPLKTLSRVANELGSGDLGARATLARRDEIGDLGRAFDDMAERIQQLLMAERELLMNLSHELRTPLARLRVALELADEASGDAGRASLREMGQDLAEMESLIDDIVTTTRLELEEGRRPHSGFPMHRELVAPSDICRRAAERLASAHRGRRLVVSAERDLPAVCVDPVLFRRVIDNLLENADKYTPDAAEEIVLDARVDAGSVVFEVRDHGMGIPAEDLPRVFEPFFRGERSRSRGSGGVGLGLTLVKRVVSAHGGVVAIDSASGTGTTVRVTLPAVENEPVSPIDAEVTS